MVSIGAFNEKGAFYGVQTLKQVFRHSKGTGILPELYLRDWPSFKIRGFMHDTGRNFQSVALLKEQINILAQYKMNVFHWHLTDDPGWRLESKLYPELRSNRAFSRQQGKFYTQKDFKDILSFCKERNITVIPEFDIPSANINEDARQFRFSNGTTTDDHGMHLVGYYEKDGVKWYLIKDSSSGSRNIDQNLPEFGYYFFHEDYIKLKMMGFTIHKDAVRDILNKFK